MAVAAGGNGGSDNDVHGQDGNHDDDVCPSSSCCYHPFSSLADPPVPSLPGIASGGGGRVAVNDK